jgi:hypothetical protein
MTSRLHTVRDRDLVQVEIPPLADAQELNMYEPQRVRILPNNEAILLLDSVDRTFDDGSQSQYNFTVDLTHYQKGVRRGAFLGARGINNIPNVNAKNNTITFNDAGFVVTATIPVGFYTATALAASIGFEMTTVAPVGAYAAAYDPLTNQITITSTALFFILPTCSFIQRGQRLTGFAEDIVPSLTKVSGFCCMAYTRYLVIQSPQLAQFTKNPFVLSNPKFYNIIGFISLDNPSTFESFDFIFPRDIFINQMSETQIATVQIQIIDEYGEDPTPIAIGDNCEIVISFVTII